MARTRRFVAVLALAAVPLAACANQDADADDVSSSLEEAGASKDQAECAGRGLKDELTQAQLNDVAKADDLADLDEDVRQEVQTIMDGCFEGTSSDGEGEGEGDGGSDTTDTTAEGDTTTTQP